MFCFPSFNLLFTYWHIYLLLAHMNRRLKGAFLIEICPCPSSLLLFSKFVNFSVLSSSPEATKLGTLKHPWVKGILVCSDKQLLR